MIVRVYLTHRHGDRSPGAYVVEEPEARDLAAAGVLEPRVELVEPQPDFDAADVAALAADLFPTPDQEA
jgi:glyoxylase-like metal-dependent hydrolase (beta-lactamase superfamily II)